MDLDQKAQRVVEITRQMDALRAELGTLLSGANSPRKISRVEYGGRVRGRKPGSKMSPEAKAKISAAAKKRWAEKKSGEKKGTAKPARKAKS